MPAPVKSMPSQLAEIYRLLGCAPPTRDSHIGLGLIATLPIVAGAAPVVVTALNIAAAPDVVAHRINGNEAYGLLGIKLFVGLELTAGGQPAKLDLDTISKYSLRVTGEAVSAYRTAMAAIGIGQPGHHARTQTTNGASTQIDAGEAVMGVIELERPLWWSDQGDASQRNIQIAPPQIVGGVPIVPLPAISANVTLSVWAYGYWDQRERFVKGIQERDSSLFPSVLEGPDGARVAAYGRRSSLGSGRRG